MGIFVNYPSNIFAGVSNTPQTIVSATTNVLWVTAIIVCNRGAAPIRFNLQKVRAQTSPVTIYYINELEIAPYTTIDIIDTTGGLQLEYNLSPSISDSLVCFSNGYTQIFDCDVCYAQLNQLPVLFG
jgi:hypothetical protein